MLLGEWSPDHKMQFQTLGNHSSSVCSLQFSPDAERLYSGTYASASRPAELISWRAAKTDNGLKRFQEEHRISIPASIAALDVIEAEGSGCRLLAIGGKDGVIRLRNADDLDHDWRSVVLKGSISILACSSDKHLLAAGTSLGQIVVFRIDDQGITEISDNSGNLAANIAALRFHPQRPELHAGFQTQNSLKVTAWDTNCWQEVGPPKILVGDLIGPSFFLAADRSTIAVIPRTAPFVLFYSLP